MKTLERPHKKPKITLQQIREKGTPIITLFENKEISKEEIVDIYKELMIEQKNAEDRDKGVLVKKYLENEKDQETNMFEGTLSQRIADIADIRTLIEKEGIDVSQIKDIKPTHKDQIAHVLSFQNRYATASK